MTEQSNVPALRQEPTRAVERVADTDSWIRVVGDVAQLAENIAGTEFVPRSLRNSTPAVAAAILYGREVGLPPMTSLTQTHVIEGKPAMSAEAMRAMVFAAGHELVIEETTGAVCTMRARRAGTDHWTTLQWTIDMARAAGVAGKQVWKAYPRQMLQARCTTELVRLVFPDVIHGFRSIEELDDGGEVEGDATAAPAEPGTKVQRTTRKRAAAKKSAAPKAQRPNPEDDAGLPLPGEDGYDALPGDGGSAGGSGDGPAAASETGSGKDSEDPPADDIHDVEIVPEPSDTPPADEPPAEPGEPAAEAEEKPREPRKASRAQQRLLFAALGEKDVADDDRHWIVGALLGEPVESFNDLTHAQASTLIDTLSRVRDRAQLDALIESGELPT